MGKLAKTRRRKTVLFTQILSIIIREVKLRNNKTCHDFPMYIRIQDTSGRAFLQNDGTMFPEYKDEIY